jgi:DNA-binding NtrC family response regulator
MKLRHEVELEQLLRKTMREHGGHRKKAAAELGISRITLYNRMIRYGMIEKGDR